MMKDYHTHQSLLHVFIVTMLSEITSTSVEPNLTLSNNTTLAVSNTARINEALDETTYAYLITNSASLLMTTSSIVTVNGISSITTVAATSTNEDSSATNSDSSIQIEYELSVFFDILTTDNSAVLPVTTNTLSSTFMTGSTTVFPLTTTILSTNQMNSTTLLSATTNIYSTNGHSTVVSVIPSEGSSGSSFGTAAIVGVTVGVFILIVILTMTVMVMCILVRKKRNKRKYEIGWTLRDATSDVIENDAVIYRDMQHQSNDGTSNAYEITVLKFNNPDLSYVKPNTSPNVTEYEIPNSVDRVYTDPGSKEDVIYNWFESNGVCKINLNDIEFHGKVGSGHFGIVNLGSWSNGSTDPVQVAVKTLNSQCSESDRVKFLREAAIMGQFVHNNVVQLHGVVTEEENMMIVLEYMHKGDLKNLLTNLQANDKLPEVLLNFCRQIAAGMNYLANKQFVHRDLAARNVLVSSDDVCKIADFGMARDLIDGIYYITSGDRKVPLKWTAPEAILYNKYSTKSDVWSFGCIIYEVWSLGHNPFENVCMKEFVNNIKNGQRLPPPPGCSRALYELMMQCWHPEAMERPKPTMILNRLNEFDVTQLDSEDEELTKLGDPLTASEQLYTDLQDLYVANNDFSIIKIAV